MRYFITLLGIATIIVVLSIGFAFAPSCNSHCDTKPAYWFYIPVPYTNYMMFYNAAPSGHTASSSSSGSEDTHSTNSSVHENPPEEEPHVQPAEHVEPIEVPHVSVR